MKSVLGANGMGFPRCGWFVLAVRSSSSFHWILIGLGWGSWGCGVFVWLSWHRGLPVDWNLLSFVAVRLTRPVVWGGDGGFCQWVQRGEMLGTGVDRPLQSCEVIRWRGQGGPFRRPIGRTGIC